MTQRVTVILKIYYVIQEIEVVSVCVPTTHHYDVVMKAIEHGKHVFRKTIVFTEEEAEGMIKAAKEKELF